MYEYALKGGYQNIYSTSFEEAIAKFEPHYQKIDELQRNTDIKILKGMEVDFFAYPGWQEEFKKAVSHLKPDYLIGSAHFVEHHGILYNSHDIKKTTLPEQNSLLYRYWQNERAAANSGLFTFMAHLDLMKKVGLGGGPQWEKEERKTIQAIKQAGVGVELNTSYFKYGAEPYPSGRIMQMLATEGIPVVISDDAHAASQLGNYFEQTEQLAKAYKLKALNKNILGKQEIAVNAKLFRDRDY